MSVSLIAYLLCPLKDELEKFTKLKKQKSRNYSNNKGRKIRTGNPRAVDFFQFNYFVPNRIINLPES